MRRIDPQMANLYAAVGERLRKLRDDAGLTQAGMSKAIGCGAGLIGKVELGETAPALHLLLAYADYFDTTLDDLVPVMIGEAAE
jgi:transcriptional regulator with XRE-family HTH domain